MVCDSINWLFFQYNLAKPEVFSINSYMCTILMVSKSRIETSTRFHCRPQYLYVHYLFDKLPHENFREKWALKLVYTRVFVFNLEISSSELMVAAMHWRFLYWLHHNPIGPSHFVSS